MKGGPTIEGEYMAVRFANANAGGAPSVTVGARVTLKPGRDYLFGGWVRRVGNRFPRLAWRCFDRDGNSVGNAQITTFTAGERYWSRVTQRLNWPRNDAQGQRLPAGAVSFEPIVEDGAAFDLAGLFLVEIPTPPSTPEP